MIFSKGYPGVPGPHTLVASAVHPLGPRGGIGIGTGAGGSGSGDETALANAGSVSCSIDMLNRVHRTTRMSILVEVAVVAEVAVALAAVAAVVTRVCASVSHRHYRYRLLYSTSSSCTHAQGNFAFGIPTDCFTREQRGWLDSAHGAAPSALYNFDVRSDVAV
jgi:hypothetical protein